MERGLTHYDPYSLMRVIDDEHKRIRAGEHSEWLTKVLKADSDDGPEKNYYRFVLEGHRFYVVISEVTGTCVTVLDHALFKRKRRATKMKRIYRSRRGKVGNKFRSE